MEGNPRPEQPAPEPPSPPPKRDPGQIPDGWRVTLVVAALALLAGAGLLWLPETPATLQIKTEISTERSVGSPTATAKTPEERTTTKRTLKTTKTLDGRRDQEAEAKPPGEAERRSETLSAALLAGSLVLLLLAAMGRVPLKIGGGGASLELAPFPAEAAAQLAKEAAEQGVTDPEQLKEAAERIQTTVAFDQWREYLDPSAKTWQQRLFLSHPTSPGDEYFSELAKSSLEAAAPEGEADEGPDTR